jgi:hypothetical protein
MPSSYTGHWLELLCETTVLLRNHASAEGPLESLLKGLESGFADDQDFVSLAAAFKEVKDHKIRINGKGIHDFINALVTYRNV